MLLTLPESLFLLALDDERGSLRYDGHHALICLHYALAGAVLGKLVLCGYLTVEQQQLVVLNPPPVGDSLLDEALQQIERAHQPRSLCYWVERLRHTLRDMQRRLGDELADIGVVRPEQHRVFGVLHSRRYPVLDCRLKSMLTHDLSQAALAQAAPEPRTRLLLCLASCAEVLQDQFAECNGAAAEAVARRLAALVAAEPVAAAVAKTIAFIEAPSLEPGG